MAEAAILSNLANPIALAGLTLVIPIILLYLLRPRPKLVKFPSTMFIRFMQKNKRFTSFLERFIRDPILLLQILVISILVIALSSPFYRSMQELRPEESVVFVIDASASMQSTDADPNRFGAAVSKASDLVRDLNQADDVSIVVAENIPAVVMTRGKPQDAHTAFARLKVSDTPTNLGDAIVLAKDMIVSSDRKKVVYVLSDFAGSGGLDPQLAVRILATSGVKVELIRVGYRGDNAGIVSMDARRSVLKETELFITSSVRNNMESELPFKLRIISNDQALGEQEQRLLPGAEGFYFFRPNITSGEQLVKLELLAGDDLKIDDEVYAYLPAVKVTKVLLLTSEGQDKFLRLMLDSLKNVDVKYAVPPVTPAVDGFDVVILGNVKADSILPGVFRDIKNHVNRGGSFIVSASDGTPNINDQDFWSMMPVDISGPAGRETQIKVTQEHDMLQDVVFDNIMVKKYYNVAERDNLTKTLIGASAFQNPIIAYREQGEGYVAYVGVNSDPAWSNLYYSSSFPIFWGQMMKYFTRLRGSTTATSLRTGEYLQLPQAQGIRTPAGAYLDSRNVFLDKAGVYEVSYADRTEKVTVNLLNAQETNTSGMVVDDIKDSAGYKISRQNVEVSVELFRYLLSLMLALIIIELLLYRRRGLL